MGHDRYFGDQVTYTDDCLDHLKQSRETTE